MYDMVRYGKVNQLAWWGCVGLLFWISDVAGWLAAAAYNSFSWGGVVVRDITGVSEKVRGSGIGRGGICERGYAALFGRR